MHWAILIFTFSDEGMIPPHAVQAELLEDPHRWTFTFSVFVEGTGLASCEDQFTSTGFHIEIGSGSDAEVAPSMNHFLRCETSAH